jgi:hypothetical protein
MFMSRASLSRGEGDWVADHLREVREQFLSLSKMEGYRLSQATIGGIMRQLADAISIAEYYKEKTNA